MKILIVADEECPALWDYYTPGKLSPYEGILSSGDLKAEYLSFLVTMARCPLMYVHGNHDGHYKVNPPEGCDSIDDKLIIYKGIRILGLGGSSSYSQGGYQYTERQMKRRIRKLKPALRIAGGVDIVLSHAAPRGVGDWDDYSHRGFETFLELLDTYRPKYLLHGHVHLNYGTNIQRVNSYGTTEVINCCEKYVLDYQYPREAPVFSPFRKKMLHFLMKNLEIIE